MKLPENEVVRDVSRYWGISTLGKLKAILNGLANNARLVYYNANGEQKFIRVIKLKYELGLKLW